jgi:hypothetical protein
MAFHTLLQRRITSRLLRARLVQLPNRNPFASPLIANRSQRSISSESTPPRKVTVTGLLIDLSILASICWIGVKIYQTAQEGVDPEEQAKVEEMLRMWKDPFGTARISPEPKESTFAPGKQVVPTNESIDQTPSK